MSAVPIEIAICGMLTIGSLPSADDGRLIFPALLLVHAVTLAIVVCVRHFPICTTTGMFVPLGALVMVNVPSVPDVARAMGWPV